MPVRKEETVTKEFMLMIIAALMGAVIVFSADIGPPFSEGPQAERHNHEILDPPNGPWAWQGGE